MAISRVLRRMTDKRDLHVEVQGNDIVVTLPGTSYVVRYYRAMVSLSNFSPNPIQAERISVPR
jgi:hypothetical protein